MEAGVGIEPAYTALQAAEGYRQIKHFGQFHFRQTPVNRSKNRLFFKDRGGRGESDFDLPTVTAFWAVSSVPNWRVCTGIVHVSRWATLISRQARIQRGQSSVERQVSQISTAPIEEPRRALNDPELSLS